MASPKNTPLLSVRAAVVLLGALLIGAAAAGLTYVATKELTRAVLAGGGVFGASVLGLHAIIGA